jgi:restriction endonuclease S subunit
MSHNLSPSLTSLIQKYNLDISIVDLKQVEWRLDAEFYQPEYLIWNSNILKHKFSSLSEITEKIDVWFVWSMVSEYTDDWVLLLQTQNVDEFFLKLESYKMINPLFHKKLKKSQVEKWNILIARSGSFGKASIYMDDEIINSSDIIIVQADEDKVDSFYLTAFINSKFGQNQLYRFASGGLQWHVNLTILESLKIPLPSSAFQSHIAELVEEAHRQRELSKSLYAEAENSLLRELDLVDWKPSEENITEKMSAEVELFGRCDAEFFQPKYDEVLEKLRSYKWWHTTLERVLESIDTWEYSESYSKRQDNFVFYIRSTNINEVWLIDIDEDYYVDPSWFKRIAKKWQIITPRVGALGIFAYIDEKLDWSVYSDNVLCMTLPDSFYPDVYSLYLNSSINRLLIERFSRGSVQQRLNQETLRFLEIPILPETIQSLVSEKVIASHSARETSKQLLEKAKRAVEIFIEEDEEKANKYLAN